MHRVPSLPFARQLPITLLASRATTAGRSSSVSASLRRSSIPTHVRSFALSRPSRLEESSNKNPKASSSSSSSNPPKLPPIPAVSEPPKEIPTEEDQAHPRPPSDPYPLKTEDDHPIAPSAKPDAPKSGEPPAPLLPDPKPTSYTEGGKKADDAKQPAAPEPFELEGFFGKPKRSATSPKKDSDDKTMTDKEGAAEGEEEDASAAADKEDGSSSKDGKKKRKKSKAAKEEEKVIFSMNLGGDKGNQWSLIWGSVLAVVLYNMLFGTEGGSKEINYQEFRNNLLSRGLVQKIVVINHDRAVVYLQPAAALRRSGSSSNDDLYDPAAGPNMPGAASAAAPTANAYSFTIASPDTFERQLQEAQDDLGIPQSQRIPVTYQNQTNWGDYFFTLAPTLLIGGLIFWSATKSMGGMGGGGGGPFSVGKSKAKMFNHETDITVKFKDVAGMDEAKQEIMEFVKFLKQPARFLALGAKIPRGAILSGPPGTGKTLIAKATAGEAGVPFFSVSGSEFVEMFVGVGSSRVRDLFATAKKSAPCIIFIDEIDAIGKARGKSGSMGGNDERESTLNQLLVEMDGFSANESIVVLAGTNRADVLDSALMRPGRFDRHIAIDRPDVGGRRQIFMVHLKPLTIEKDLSRELIAEKLALLTPGFSGADIANVCNEAALHCARREGDAIGERDFETAIERVIVGLERKSRVLGKDEKKTVAYHEAGHAVCGWFLEFADPLLKVSIIPRGVGALGYAQYLPKERFLYSTEQLMDRMCMTLGGRVAEEIFFKRITTGAQDDLQKVTKMAFEICSNYGMNETIGPVSYGRDNEGFQKPFSEKTGQMLDDEVRAMVQQARERTRTLLTEKREQVELVAQQLLEKEVLTRESMVALLGKRPFDIQDDMDDFLDRNKGNSKIRPEEVTEKKAAIEEKAKAEVPLPGVADPLAASVAVKMP